MERAKGRDRTTSGAISELESEPAEDRTRELKRISGNRSSYPAGFGSGVPVDTGPGAALEQHVHQQQAQIAHDAEVHRLRQEVEKAQRQLDETQRLLALQDQLSALLAEQDHASKQDALRCVFSCMCCAA